VTDLVKEKVVFLLAEDFQHGRTHLVLVARVAGDEVFHVCVAAGGGLLYDVSFLVKSVTGVWLTCPLENNTVSIGIDNVCPLHPETRFWGWRCHIVLS